MWWITRTNISQYQSLVSTGVRDFFWWRTSSASGVMLYRLASQRASLIFPITAPRTKAAGLKGDSVFQLDCLLHRSTKLQEESNIFTDKHFSGEKRRPELHFSLTSHYFSLYPISTLYLASFSFVSFVISPRVLAIFLCLSKLNWRQWMLRK